MVKYKKQLYLLITLALVLSSFSFDNHTAGAATLLSDDFTGTTIDTAKWNEIDPAGAGGTSGNIQQNGSLSIANSFSSGNWAQNGLISQNSFSNTNLSISAVMTRGSDQLLGYGDYNFQSAGTKSYIIDLSSGGCLMLVWDNGSLANNTSCGSNISGATYELRLVSGGFEAYANGTLKGTLSTSTVVNNKPVYLESSAAASTYDDVLVTGVSNNTAPDAPTSLSATAGDTQVGLTWSAPVNNGGSAITDYLVEYKLTSSGSWNTFNDGTSTSASATVTGLTNNSSYDFRVSAINAIGTSSPSSTATATPSPPTVPAAPTIGTATAGNGQASVSFTPGSNGGSAITSFTVTSSPGGFTGSGSSSPITVSGLSNGTAYTFTVTATNAIGTSSASSASNSVTPSTEVPTSIANLSLWLDGSDTNSITTSSGNITQINDKSGNDNNATASGGFTPALISNAQNGRSVMRFNGTSNYLTISNSVTYRTVVVVAKYNGTTFSDYNGIVGDPTGSSPNNGHIVNGVAGTEKIASATSSYTSAYRDGTSIAGSGGHDFSPLNEYWIGVFELPASNTNTTSSIGFINGGSRYWNGDIAEVIAYSSTLTVDQRTSLEAYLSTKWNITVAGPSSPGAPTGVSADPGDAQVALTWSAPGSNGGSSITDYQIEYKLSSDSSWTTFNDGTSTSTSATVTGLTNNSSYDFRVSAINGVGTGTASSTATATPHAPTAPSAPTGVSANAGNAQATVSFSTPASGGSPITSYTVTSSPGGLTASGSSSPITVTGLTNGQSYTFTVTATNAIGTSSASAASNSVTPATIGNVLVDDFTGTTINTSKWNEIDPGGLGGTSGSIQQNGSLTIANSYVGGAWGANALVSQDSFVATNLEFSATMTAGSSPLLGYGDYVFGDPANTAYLLYLTGPGSGILGLVWQGGSFAQTSCGSADVGAATYKMKIISGGFEVYKNNSLLCTVNTGVVITNKPVFMENATTASTFDDVLVYGTATVHSVPDAPTIGTATAGDSQASVTFSAPANNGGSTITSYTVTSSPGGLTASGSSSPITVTGLTNGQSYTFTVTATNSVGTSAASAASNSATPTAPPAPGQVTNLEALGVNQQVLLNWDAPGSGGSPSDYAIFYKLSSDSTWTAFIDGVSAVTKTTVTGLTNGAAYDFQVFAVNGGGSGTGSATATATPNAISTLAFVITGESNSGGIGLNSDATSQEMQPHSAVQIMNLTSGNFQFENLQIGVNNLRDHAGLESYYDNSHGFELQLANSTEANAFPDNPQVYLIKTGHGGSTVSQWDVNGTYWTKFLQRTNAGKASVPAGRQWVVWMSLGINDSIAGTPTSTWKAAMVAHINKIKAQLPGAIIVMTEFQSMTAGSGYPAYNAIMDQIAAEEANVYVIDSTGAALRDGNHWSYSGLKTVTSRMVTVTENALGLVYPGTPTGLNVTPSGTQAALPCTLMGAARRQLL